MYHLLNAANMPQPGNYKMTSLKPKQFSYHLKKAYNSKVLETYIGYGKTAGIIKELTGINVQLSRQKTLLEDGDILLVIRLKYRVQSPSEKRGEFNPTLDDYEFFWADYTK